jgi:hypothetical protein
MTSGAQRRPPPSRISLGISNIPACFCAPSRRQLEGKEARLEDQDCKDWRVEGSKGLSSRTFKASRSRRVNDMAFRTSAGPSPRPAGCDGQKKPGHRRLLQTGAGCARGGEDACRSDSHGVDATSAARRVPPGAGPGRKARQGWYSNLSRNVSENTGVTKNVIERSRIGDAFRQGAGRIAPFPAGRGIGTCRGGKGGSCTSW